MSRMRGGGGDDRGGDRGNSAEAAGSVGAAMLLIAGTTVGGGFLALPYVVAPAGFLPSALSLCGIWLFFIAQSFVVVEVLSATAAASGRKGVGMTAVAGSVLGRGGELAVTMLIVVLTKAVRSPTCCCAASLLTAPVGAPLAPAITRSLAACPPPSLCLSACALDSWARAS